MSAWAELPERVEINELGPRDGFQAESEFIPTERKVEIGDRRRALAHRGRGDTGHLGRSPKGCPATRRR